MAEQGWLAIELPEDDGGLGLGMVELAVLCEEIGRRLVAAPFLPTIVALGALCGDEARAVAANDEVVEDKGVKILVDPKAVLFLLGTEMDYKADKMQSQFIFNNPNQTGACGCGESVQIEPATGVAGAEAQ